MLNITHISKTFNPGTVNEKKAITDLSLHLSPGDFVTIIGSNGAGKSTLFNAIAGSFLTDGGSIVLDGRDITFLPEFKRAKSIGRLFQDPMRGSAPGMTIEENLALAYLRTAKHQHAYFSRTGKGDRAFFRDQLAKLDMGLEDRMKQPVGLLSGGQRQALTLLMASLVKPKLLLLDEPVTGLDPTATSEMYQLIGDLNKNDGMTIIMVSHDVVRSLECANRILCLCSRDHSFFGTPEEYANSHISSRFLGD